MRGRLVDQSGLFSYVDPEKRIPAEHPLRKIRALVREVLKALSHSFGRLYAREGRPSIPPEQLLSALLLQVFYGIRSERLLMEPLDYNLLFRWFVGLSPDNPVWDATVFGKAKERSTTHLLGSSTKPRLASGNLTTSSAMPRCSAASTGAVPV